MKKYFLISIVFLFLCSCATGEYKNGTEVFKISRPIFSVVGGSVVKPDGTIITISASASVSIDTLATMALQGYAKYMSGGLASSPAPTAVLVPKAEAQATPPPAEIIR
jgi:hypothetical protein